jgi:hypothetical protein
MRHCLLPDTAHLLQPDGAYLKVKDLPAAAPLPHPRPRVFNAAGRPVPIVSRAPLDHAVPRNVIWRRHPRWPAPVPMLLPDAAAAESLPPTFHWHLPGHIALLFPARDGARAPFELPLDADAGYVLGAFLACGHVAALHHPGRVVFRLTGRSSKNQNQTQKRLLAALLDSRLARAPADLALRAVLPLAPAGAARLVVSGPSARRLARFLEPAAVASQGFPDAYRTTHVPFHAGFRAGLLDHLEPGALTPPLLEALLWGAWIVHPESGPRFAGPAGLSPSPSPSPSPPPFSTLAVLDPDSNSGGLWSDHANVPYLPAVPGTKEMAVNAVHAG